MTTPCLVGHTVPGAHLDGALEDPTHSTDCLGCRPAMADEDAGWSVCSWHGRRQRWAIAAAPDLVAHLRDHLQPGSSSEDRVRGTRTPPAPMNLGALDAADFLHSALASWVQDVLDARTDLHAPSWAGGDVRPASSRSRARGRHRADCTGCSCFHLPAALGPHRARCTPCRGCATAYDPARMVGVRDPRATVAVARWLLTHLDWCLTQPWAGEFVTEVPELVGTLRARWPIEERPVRVPVPCPACAQRTLVRHAPRWAGAPITVACDRIECGHIVPEDRYEFLTKLVQYMGRAAG